MSSHDEFAKRFEKLSPAKQELLLEQLRQRGDITTAAALISRQPHRGPHPLSFAQQRLWFYDQLEPNNPFYNISAAVDLEGSIDVELLRRCLTNIVKRHESLRTRFARIDGQPVQIVSPDADVCFEHVRLTEITSRQEREAQAQQIARREAQTPFDLAKGPLFRTTLLELGGGGWRLLVTMHHIISDGWSMAVLRREIAELYRSYVSGAQKLELPSDRACPALSALPIQYVDFAVWQRQWLTDNVLQRQLRYWRDRLEGGSPPLELPSDRPRPAVQSFQGNMTTTRVDAATTEKLMSLLRDRHATLYMGLLAALLVLLKRYSGQTDISVGSPIAHRPAPCLENLIGFFVNTIVLRGDLSGDPNFGRLLEQVRKTTLSAFSHIDTPFEKLVDELRPERDLSRTPLFQVMLVLQNLPQAATEIPGVRIGAVQLGHGQTANFDLTFNVEEAGKELNILLIYNTDIFNHDTAERMLAAYTTLLTALAERGANVRLSQLPLLSGEARQLQLQKWNDTACDYPSSRCLHELFSQQAQRTPKADAVVHEDEVVSYEALEKRSNQLAHRLAELGAGPETAVGVCLDRSPQLIISILAILKVGGAYVPLDPDYPSARLSYMVKDSGAALVVTNGANGEDLGRFKDGLGDRAAFAVVDLQVERKHIDRAPTEPPAARVTPDHLAYIIYTSGSTGNPKGVEVSHRSVVNYVDYIARQANIAAGDRIMQYVSFSFDASIEEIYPVLLRGGALVQQRAPSLLSPRELVDFLLRHRINLLHHPSPILRGIIEELEKEEAAPSGTTQKHEFKTIITGGDALSPQLVRQWRQWTGEATAFLFVYGVTEAAVTNTLFRVSDLPLQELVEPPPIGRPIGNTEVYILDDHLQPMPVGIPGQLFVGGVGLARGYRGDSAKTAESFVPHPYSRDPGRRLYKTGDLARFRADGNIEFLGRMDDQVKIRGYRIELGEIETALLGHPLISGAVVMAREDTPGVRRLAAYFTRLGVPDTEPSTVLASSELRAFLKEKLPSYMIPYSFTELDQFPTSANQKVDRKALPPPDLARPDLDHRDVPPRNHREEQLAAIWKDVLGLNQVGVYDNFFDLGGDSILSIQIISRASEAGIHFSPKQLFLHQNIAELAEAAGEAPSIMAEQGIVSGDVPLTPIQHQWLALSPPSPEHFNQAVLLEVDHLSADVLRRAMQYLVRHHDALRIRFSLERRQQTIAPPGDTDFEFEEIDLSSKIAVEQSQQIEEEAGRRQSMLDIEQGPLVRAAYFHLGDGAKLLWIIHHFAVDGVSWRILLEDLQLLCHQYDHRQAPELPPKTTSFQQWSDRMLEWTRSNDSQNEADFWLRQSGECNILQLPHENPLGENLVGTQTTIHRELSVDETQSLLHEVPPVYRTQMNDVLLTALCESWRRWETHENQPAAPQKSSWRKTQVICVNLETHGRQPIFDDAGSAASEQIDTSRTVGWFTSLFPVFLHVPENENPGEKLKSVKEQLRRIPSGGVGFGLLRWLRSDEAISKKLASAPQPQLSFNYLGRFDQVLGDSSRFRLAAESTGALQAPQQKRLHLVDIIAYVQRGRFKIQWTYSHTHHQEASIQFFADAYCEALRRLIVHCQSPRAGGFTASDFPLADLDAEEMDALSQLLGDDDLADSAASDQA